MCAPTEVRTVCHSYWLKLEQEDNGYLWQEYCKMLLSSFWIVTDPLTDGLKDKALVFHIKFIMVKDVTEFHHRQLMELPTGNNLFKVIEDKLEGLLLQLGAVMDVAELPDADAVVSREHLHQEVTTSLYNPHYIELVSRLKKFHGITGCHKHSAGVCIQNDESCHIWRKVFYLVDSLVWCRPACKQGSVEFEIVLFSKRKMLFSTERT